MSLATSYDDVPYPRLTFPLTHPSHLATIGRLLGLRPAAVDRCRVLEFGCASGSNLVPIAYGLPGSICVGIDLSGRQIAAARGMADGVGTRNTTFEQFYILEAAGPLAERFGQFDYIIAHGLYSWVPEAVKEALLAACRQLLAPEGIAYVSYNCYPGCEPRDMLRRMCQYHGRRETEPRQDAAGTRRFLEFLHETVPKSGDAYPMSLLEKAASLLSEPDGVLLHDDLERDNDPVFFHQFMAHATRHGLQYLGDAHFGQMFGVGVEAAALDKIRRADDELVFEQYLDFFYGRALRTTLLCRAEQTVERGLTPEAVRQLWFSSAAVPISGDGTLLLADQVTANDGQPVTFRAPDCTLSVATPSGKAALAELALARPTPLPFAELLARVRRRLPSIDAAGERQLLSLAIEWFAMQLVELHAFSPPLAAAAGDRPVASAVARYQLRDEGNGSGQASGSVFQVPNLFNRRVRLGGELAAVAVLALLDGQHDRAAIVAKLAAPVLDGRAAMRVEGRTVGDPQEVRRFVAERVETCLADFSRNALLVEIAQ